jgi:hypothetical protein
MTREDIISLRRTAFRRFYGRPSFILKKLFELRTPHDLATAFKSMRSLFHIFVSKDRLRA